LAAELEQVDYEILIENCADTVRVLQVKVVKD